jgi:hypothetical protein
MTGSSDIFNRADVVIKDGFVVKNRFGNNIVVGDTGARQFVRHKGTRTEGLVNVPDYYLETVVDGRIVSSVRLLWSTLYHVEEQVKANGLRQTVVTFDINREEVQP